MNNKTGAGPVSPNWTSACFFILRIFSCPHCCSSLAVATNPSQTTLSEEIPQQIMLLPDGAGAGRKTGDKPVMQPPAGAASPRRKVPGSSAALEKTRVSRTCDLVRIFENLLVAEAVQRPSAVTESFPNNQVMDCLSVVENECASRFSQAGLTFSAQGPFCPCPSV